MTQHQTQSEQVPATPRRTLATGSSLPAVLILLSMLPPSAGLVAVSALGDDPVRITLRDPSTSSRRETRVLPVKLRTPVATAAHISPTPRTLHGVTDLAPTHYADERFAKAPGAAPVREALLALPPPRA